MDPRHEIIDLTGSIVSYTIIELDDSFDGSSNDSEKRVRTINSSSQTSHKSRKDQISTEERNKSKSRSRSQSSWGECPICCDALGTNPLASTICGHIFCMKCLETSLKSKPKCPTCRHVLKGRSAYHPLYLHIN